MTLPSITRLICLITFSGLAVTQTSYAQNEENSEPTAADVTPDTIDVEATVEDAKISERLEDILEASGWFAEIKIQVRNGIVTINGQADTSEHSLWAEDIAKRTTGVIGVRNELEVDTNLEFADSMSIVFNSLRQLYRDFLLRLPFLIAGLLFLVATWLFAKFSRAIIERIFERRARVRQSVKDLVTQLFTISVWIIGLLLATVIIFPGMTPAKALTVLGLGSVAIGFAFKDIFENFFAGILILWKYPFDRGDFIEHADIIGRVEEITIRNTLIRRPDGELVIVPNAEIFKSNVEVLTNQTLRRQRIICGVAYREEIESARKVIREAVESCPSVDQVKEIQIFAHEFADSSINFEVAWWTGPTPKQFRLSRDEVITAIKSALDRENIEIPYPYRTLTFADPLPTNINGNGFPVNVIRRSHPQPDS